MPGFSLFRINQRACIGSSLRAHSLPTLRKIIAHPFNEILYSGNLPLNCFHQFLHADSRYLNGYGTELQSLAHRITFYGTPFGQDLTSIALGVIRAESKMQRNYLLGAKDNTSPDCENAVQQYLAHLRHCGQKEENPLVALAAFIPCFWVYRMLGTSYTIDGLKPDHPYYNWIRTYHSPSFIAGEQKLWSILGSFPISEQTTVKIHATFERSVQLELNLFDSAIKTQLKSEAIPDLSPDYRA